MSCGPVRTMFMKKFNQSVLIVEGESISSFILPTNVHRAGTKVAVPRVPNMLTDGVQKIVHCEGVKTIGAKKNIVCHQCSVLCATEGW